MLRLRCSETLVCGTNLAYRNWILRGGVMHGVETNMKSPKNPNDIIAMQLNGCLQEAHDAYVHYFHENHIDYRLLSMFAICC